MPRATADVALERYRCGRHGSLYQAAQYHGVAKLTVNGQKQTMSSSKRKV